MESLNGRSMQRTLLVCTVLAGAHCGCTPAADPSDTSSGSSRTAAPAQVVGTATCAECHAENAALHATSGHSRTLRPASDVSFRDELDGLTYTDPVRHIDFHYAASNDSVTVSIPEMFGESPFPLQYAFGSGQHAVTFMTLLETPGADTIGIEHRMSWFGHNNAPGETPQPNLQHPTIDAEFFGKSFEGASLQRCFSCHSTTGEIQAGAIHNLRPNVGCENCHGPGSEHVAAVQAGADDLHIDFASGQVNRPDEIQVCGQCHRTADMLPASQLSPENRLLVRFQPAGLVQSPCYLRSEGRLKCSTCHNPHEHASARSRELHIQTCLNCHADPDHVTVCPVSPTDKCISCHMPPVQIRDGISFHDHWIRVRDEQPGSATFDEIPHKE